MQQGMLFHSAYAAESGIYVEQLQFTLEGAVDLDTLRQAWQQLIDQHDVLRTCFIWQRTQTLQVVLKQVDLPWHHHDWQHVPEQQQKLQEWLQHDQQTGFDTTKAPLMRCTLITLGHHRHQFVWTYHHALLDGWSLSMLMQDLLINYQTSNQQRVKPGVNRRPYQTYVAWLQQQDRTTVEAYWQQQLTGFLTPTPLPLQAREHTPSLTSDLHEWKNLLRTDFTQEIQAWVRQQRISLATLIYGVWGILLSRYSGESDVTFGITVSGRDIPLNGVEDMVGLFINTLPLRVTLSSGSSSATVLKQLQQDLQALQSYSYMPLVEIQRLSKLPHDLFNTLVVIENYPIDQTLQDYQQTLPLQNVIASERTNYPLTLVMIPGQQLSLNFAYNSDLFTIETIKRLSHHFEALLQAIVNDSSAPIATLPMATNAEQQLLTTWNQTTQDYSQACIHQLFEQQVDKAPDAIAVISENTQLTYQALNQRANQLAHHLQGLGVGPDTLVGICVERSPEMVVGLLAILKAGGVYVPIDPYYPEARIEFMLEDTQVSVLLTQTHLLDSLPDLKTQVICLDKDWTTIAQNSSKNLSVKVMADHLAYVIFTSGSTGQPKGVMVPHRAISNQMQWIQQTFPLEETDKFLQRTNFSFDASVWEFYAPLLAGAQLVLASPGRFQAGDFLVKTIIDQQITHIQLVPSLLRLLLEQPDFDQCRSLKQVFCGGEALSVDLPQAFFGQLDASLHNLYGPTEACINSTYWTCNPGETPKTIPIGRPVANAQAYILDANLQLVPMGAPGELHIGGAGIAKGYLNRPELTAEKFIANPLGAGRLYKTGDLACYQADGAIEYLGRIDHQVKIRGFRIELGEIEAALIQHEQIKAGVVLMREDEPGDQRLVAYVVSDGEVSKEVLEEELKTALKQRLPDYMVPTMMVPLDEMPLMPNGKIDRQALPTPTYGVSQTEGVVAPQTERQILITNLFAEILSIPAEAIGIHDDFFQLGGHSLLAMRLITSLRQTFEREIPLRVLFETPTVAGVDTVLDTQNSGDLRVPQITPTPRNETPIPLSYAQERLWFLAQLEGVSATYNMPGAVRVEGSFDVALLQQALGDMIRRHEVLRTTFPVVNGAAVQQIHPTLEMPLRVIESSELTVPLPDWLNHEVQQPFDLTTGPLLRVALVRLKPDTAVLVLTMHHIISDGWSIGVFIRELIGLYGPDGGDKPALPVQYADYAQWQRQWLQGEVLDTQLGYWRQQLADAPILLELPTDHPRPAVQSFNGRTQVITLPKPLSDQLEALSKQHQVTLFMTLLTAFQILLYRYSNQPDIVVGSSIANRQQAELEPLIGLFVNTLVLRSHITPTDSVKSLLQQVKQMTLEAYSHKDVPFEQIVEILQPQRSLAHSPLFQVMFMLQNTPKAPLELPNMTVTPLPAESVAAKFDLTLSIEDSDQGLVGQWEYNTDLFEPDTIARMANHFEVLLTAMVTDTSQSVATLPLLTAPEQQQLTEWNNTGAPYPDVCLHTLVEQQAQRTPDAVAVVFEKEQLTYQNLNTKADCLAHYLKTVGVGPDTLVGICVERSVDMMVGLLGILKAGGAYIPLDPHYPQQRLAVMVDDADIEILVSQSWLLNLLPSYNGKTVCLDQPIASPVSSAHPPQAENLAYMIYTSGSTGRPKGVQITHNSVVDLLHSQRQALGISQQDTILSAASFSFDMSILELWLPLVVGARLVLVSRDVAQDGLRLADQINTHGVTLMQATPATWRMLLDANWAGSSQLQIICGGEALPPDLASALISRCATLRNFYGPTEATVWATQQAITADKPITVGRPLANTQIYLLDESFNPVPVGVPGELYIGGVRLSRGYYQRPSLTAERFIPNPFSQIPGARLYRTGDLARYLPDGTLDYLGRADYQVKLRGFRIELGEIEMVLDRHEQVQQCAVIVHKDTAQQERLVAYVVGEVKTNDLKQHLRQHLPDYMVPNAVMFLPALPLTPNGKLDRKALPEPDYEHTTEFVAPQTERQKLIAALFANVLTLPAEQIGIYDNFFELGGHSLLATQIITRMRQIFHVTISVRQLFETPTVVELATWLGEQRQAQQDAISRVERDQPLPLSFAQERLWFIQQLDLGSGAYNQTMAVRLNGNLDIEALRQSLQTIVDRHETLRTTFILQQGKPVQQIATTLAAALPILDLPTLTPEAEEIQRLATIEEQAPFDLTQGPLFRARILRLQEKEHVLLWTTHHIISDIWSTGVLVNELATLYTAYTTSSLPLLESLPIQYADFAVWQRQWLTGEVLDQQLTYWRQKLGGQLPVLNLPADYPPPETPSFRGDMAKFQLPATLANKLHRLSQDNGATLFMALLAGFKTLLYAHTGQSDMLVGTDIANRNRAEIEGLIGFFINLLVLRTDLSGNPSFQDLLQRVRDVALDSYAHQDLPFSQLVQTLQTDTRRGGATPLVQVLFVMQNAPFTPLELPDITLTPVSLETNSARFDLALFVNETPDGITVAWNYSTDRFAGDTISRLAQQFETLLTQAVSQPDISLETLTSMITQQQSSSKGPKRRKKFKRVAPQAVQQSAADVVNIQPLSCGVMTVQANSDNVDLAPWAKGERTALNQQLSKHGALLFRGFSITTAKDFEQAAEAICPDLFGEYGDLPRTGVSDKVYGSTPYPEDKAILFHNESSHLQQWPMKIWFCCLQPAKQGGATPIVDCRKIYQALSPEIRDCLDQKQLMYVRNYIKGLDVNWQDFFHTNNRSVVEQRCQTADIEWEWLADDGLQTRQIRPALARHPHTGEGVVFNQLQLHHLSYLDQPTQQSLLSLFGEDRLPRQVYYGDGSPIEPEVLHALQTAYTEAEQFFTWQQGDMLMLDNMLMAHGRQSYVGPRKIAVAMGEIMTQANLNQVSPSPAA